MVYFYLNYFFINIYFTLLEKSNLEYTIIKLKRKNRPRNILKYLYREKIIDTIYNYSIELI